MNPCVINSEYYWLRRLVSFHRDKVRHLMCHLVWLNTLIMLLHFLSITQSFLYTTSIIFAKVITRFILLWYLSTKLWTISFFATFPNFFHIFFFIISNTFKLSLISLVEFFLPNCCFKCNFITKKYNFCNKDKKISQDYCLQKMF